MYVALVGPKGKESVTVREDFRDLLTGKKKARVVKTYGPLKTLLEKDPEFVTKLKKQVKEETQKIKDGKSVQVTLSCEEVKHAEDGYKMLNIGHIIVDRIWQLLGIDAFLEKNIDKRNAKRIRDNMYYLVSHRLSSPASVLATSKDANQYAGIGDIARDVLYSALDELSDLTDDLINHLGEQFQKKTTRNLNHVCYDVTNYYFESTDAGELRLFGYSKEHKNNEVIVVMGLLIDSNGIPIAFKLFPGNTMMDQHTLTDSVVDLKKRYGFKEVTVVADRGMNSGENLVFLSNEGHHFVISYTLKRAKESFRVECLNSETWEQSTFNNDGELVFASKVICSEQIAKVPYTQEELTELVKERQANGGRGRLPKYKDVKVPVNIHVTYSKSRAEKDKSDRDRAIEKLRTRIKRGGVAASFKHGCNHYLAMVDEQNKKYEIDESKVQYEAQFDGFYAIVTDRLDLTTDEVGVIYKDQWKIEESFRILKTDLQARPVFVWTDKRIQGHFCLCYLSLCMIRYAQYLFTEKKQETISAQRIMMAIADANVILLGDEKRAHLGTSVTQDFIALSEALGLPYLQKTMTPSRFKALTGFDVKQNIIKLIGQP